jgi:peroxiredoxin
MRRLSFVGLLGVLAAAAGCGSPPELAFPAFDPDDLKGNARRFHEKPANKSESAEQIPLRFIALDGTTVDLASFRGKSNVVLVIVKGMPHAYNGAFCPGCRAQLNALAANYEQFKARDAEILMVFPGPTDQVPEFLVKGQVDGAGGNPKLPFVLLTDTDLKAVDTLGIRGDLAKPSTYILDKKGNPVFAYVGGVKESFDRPSVKALLDQLDKLNATK